MIEDRDFAQLEYNDIELLGLIEEMVRHHGKEYCVVPSALLLSSVTMIATESERAKKRGGPGTESLRTACSFVGTIIVDALHSAGFSNQEIADIGEKILDD